MIKLRLGSTWKEVAKKAWSVKLMLLAIIILGCELVLPLYMDMFPRNLFAVISMFTMVLALWARFIVLEKLLGTKKQ